MPLRMARLEENVHEIRGALTKQLKVVDEMARDLSRFCTSTTTSLAWMIDRAGVSYMSYTQTPIEYQRRVRRRTDDAGTSAAQQDQQHPDSCSLLIKPVCKFSTIVHDTEPCRIFTLNARIRKKDDFK
ncbi:hypothetical protein Tco_0093048 [Tanacetum coccineum]